MKFSICRSSDYGKLNKPCDGAFSQGVGRGLRWFIEIDSMDQLLSLAKKESQIIINADIEPPSLEIYDDWRE